MTISFQILVAGAAVLVFGLLGILLLVPSKKTKRNRMSKEERTKASEAPATDWQAVSLKLERHIQAMRKEVEELQKKERAVERELIVQKEKYIKLADKLAQERDWKKREEDELDKKTKEVLASKDDLRKMEHDLGLMHAERLRFERELKEAKSDNEAINTVRRDLELQTAKLSAENESLRKQVKEFRWEVERLSEKKDAESWVPKQDYEKLEAQFRNKEKDLAHLKEQLKKEI